MHLVLKPEIERFIDDQIRAGRFSSREALIEAALAEFQHADQPDLDDAAVSAIHEGLDQANRDEGVDLDTFRAQFFNSRS